MVTATKPRAGVKQVGQYEVNVRDRARMFKSDFLEKFSYCHWSMPLVLYVPVIGLCIYAMAVDTTSLTVGGAIGMAFAGIFFWSLAEYWLHRKLFHFDRFPKMHFFLHGVHHEFPNDLGRLVMPPTASMALAIPLYFAFTGIFGYELGLPFFAGFVAGYLWYDMTHLWTHVGKPKSRWAKALKKHHMLHHFQTHDKRFGVSTPMWDYVFGTWEKHEKPAAAKQGRSA